MKQQVIYKIRNVTNGKFYVGSTTNTRERFRTHRNFLRRNRHHCKHLQAAWNLYGEDCFKFEIVEVIPDGESLQAAEDRWLAEHVGQEHCYNIGLRSYAPWRGGAKEKHPSFGRVRNEQEREAISASLREFYAADIANHPRFGKRHSEETKAKIRASREGKMSGETHYRYGQTLSAEVRKKIGDAQRGKPKAPRKMSEEARARLKGRPGTFTGKTHTMETRLKLSKAVHVLPDDTTFPSLTAVLQHYGFKMPTLNRALKSGLPLSKGPMKGYSFRYVDSLP